MSDQLSIKIITPEGVLYQSECDSISVQTSEGEITVLPNHIPLISPIKHGEVRVAKGESTIPFAISGGVVEVNPENEIVLLVENGDTLETLDTEKIQEAVERAQQAMADKDNILEIDFAHFAAQLDRDLNRLKVATKWRK